MLCNVYMYICIYAYIYKYAIYIHYINANNE